MSTLLSIGNEKSPDLIVLFTCAEVIDDLFLAALEWGDERSKSTHYVRRSRFERVPCVPAAYLSDPARLMTITFYYESQPLEKAAELATNLYDEVTQSLIIVENDEESYLGDHAVANTLALLSTFSHNDRRSIVCLPFDENLAMISTLFTDHVFVYNEDGTLSELDKLTER
ncbi:unnamed protein product [Cylicocyclus nassatus]|uniref:Uncharacterized protein n=1 Tax=Cylicocyclus nassatus TaxID=53992 RepID=A0AA36GV99_CYLNA|nr:unnamed protein product [Cylicocyclus nassatus]